jgi:hypothetical protein
MRNHVLLLSAALLLAACGDDHPSAPTASRGISGSHSAGDASSVVGPVWGQSKPTDQVGFTKVTAVVGPHTPVAAGAAGLSTVLCPAGSVVVGGSFRYIFFDDATTPPWIFKNDTDGQNGWSVTIVNTTPGSFQLTYQVTAYCAS